VTSSYQAYTIVRRRYHHHQEVHHRLFHTPEAQSSLAVPCMGERHQCLLHGSAIQERVFLLVVGRDMR
jgi:hypothetical protein